MLSEVFVAFQPIVSLKSMQIVGYEALARTKTSPASFPADLLSQDQNRRAEAELLLMHQALITQPGLPGTLSVNLSAPTLILRQQDILRLIKEHGPFCIEILESQNLSVDETEQLIRSAASFTEAGGCLALDDIGTGADRLLLLCSGIVSIIKTDRSLLKKPQLLANTVATAKRLGIKAVVEGIETPAQLEAASRAKADFAQGFLLGKPLQSWVKAESITTGERRKASNAPKEKQSRGTPC